MMETAYYEEYTPTSLQSFYHHNQSSYTMNPNVNQLKRKQLTLNFADNKTSVIKKAKVLSLQTPQPGGKVDILSSPDLHMLKLASPDLEKFIISGVTPGSLATPTSLFFPNPTNTPKNEGKESFIKGFDEALARVRNEQQQQQQIQQQQEQIQQQQIQQQQIQQQQIQQQQIQQQQIQQQPQSQQRHYVNLDHSMSSSAEDSSSSSYQDKYGDKMPGDFNYQFESQYTPEHGVIVKEEPLENPSAASSPPMSPINMESQEKIKLERKRQRNRVAASKCRKRKLERIAKLEDKVKQLKGENGELSSVLAKLKDTVARLKAQVMEHVNSGCQFPHQNLY